MCQKESTLGVNLAMETEMDVMDIGVKINKEQFQNLASSDKKFEFRVGGRTNIKKLEEYKKWLKKLGL